MHLKGDHLEIDKDKSQLKLIKDNNLNEKLDGFGIENNLS